MAGARDGRRSAPGSRVDFAAALACGAVAAGLLGAGLLLGRSAPPGPPASAASGLTGSHRVAAELARRQTQAPPSSARPGRGSPSAESARPASAHPSVAAPGRSSRGRRASPRLRPEPVVEGVIGPGDTLFSALGKRSVPSRLVLRISRELRPVFDFRRAHPGDRYRLVRDAEGELVSFEYRVSPLERYRVLRRGENWVAERETVAIERRRARLAGVISTNLYDAIVSLGEQPELATDFANVFAWQLDFSRVVHPGDEFWIVYERLYAHGPGGSELYLRPGKILAARYRGAVGDHIAVYFESEPGRGGYYRPDGTSLEGEFLVAPVRYSRISSGYSYGRWHPILKVRRPHLGIDYAAPEGTPVWAVADGTVVYRGWAGGFGRLVKIRHAHGYVSYYGHLSRFAPALHVGQFVRQKQVIGFVGHSGLATGPHVDFRITKNGHYVNPRRLHVPAGRPVPPNQRARFARVRDAALEALGPPPLAVTDEAL